MTRLFPRQTLAASAELHGKGLHSGQPVRVILHPGDKGVAFHHQSVRFPAEPASVTDTRRCTTLGTVATVEHLMSALSGMGVTDVEIEVDGPEMPGLDGSSRGWVELLLATRLALCGTLEVEGPFTRVFTVAGDSKVAVTAGTGKWRYEFDLEPMGLGWQIHEATLSPEEYAREIAPARTTVFQHELPHLMALGLGQGLTGDDVVIIQPGGYENQARFPDEPARHKLLDLVGDLYLTGVPAALLSGVGVRCGHTANVLAASRLAAHVKLNRLAG